MSSLSASILGRPCGSNVTAREVVKSESDLGPEEARCIGGGAGPVWPLAVTAAAGGADDDDDGSAAFEAEAETGPQPGVLSLPPC